jgi:competence protein ComEC
MVRYSVLFALGVWMLQQQGSLPEQPGLWLLVCAFLFVLTHLAGSARGLRGFRIWRGFGIGRLWRHAALAAAVFGMGFCYAAWRADVRLADALPAAWEGKDIALVGVVAELPRQRADGTSFAFDVERVLTPGAHVPAHIVLTTYDHDQGQRVAAGQRWRFTVRLKRPHGAYNPYGFDFEAWMLERDLRAGGYVKGGAGNVLVDPRVMRAGYLIERMRGRIRDRFRRVLGDAPYAGVLVALAIGDEASIPAAQWQVFTRTGTSHLMSISGLHISMLATLAFAAVYAAWRRVPRLALALPARKAAAMAGMLAGLGYAVLSGFSIPAQRTVYMLIAISAGLIVSRRLAPGQLLAAALWVVLLADPWAVDAPGFWLSFGAVALILFVSANRLGKVRWLAEYGRVQWAMLAGMVAPLLALFQQLSLVSPVANAFAIPLVSFVVAPLSILSAVVPVDALMRLAHAAMAACMAALEWLAGLPDAVWQQHAPPPWSIVLGMAGALWLLMPRGFPARWLGALMLLPMFLVLPPAPPYGALRLVVFDVGQGLAVAAQTQNHVLLYDTGPDYPGDADAGNRILVPSLRAQGISRLDALILTHDDTDHTGGALSVLNALPVGWMLSSLPPDSPIVQRARVDRRCADGQAWEWDGVRFQIVHPSSASYADPEVSKNNRGCTLRIIAGANSVLLAADIEKESEARLLRLHPDMLQATVLVVPHHGSLTSSTRAFVQAVHPRYAIFSVGYRNRFGHPKAAVEGRYRDAGSTLVRSDRAGAVVVDMDGGSVRLQRWRDVHRRYWQQ